MDVIRSTHQNRTYAQDMNHAVQLSNLITSHYRVQIIKAGPQWLVNAAHGVVTPGMIQVRSCDHVLAAYDIVHPVANH